MKPFITLALALSLGCAFTGCNKEDAKATEEKTKQAADNAGTAMKDAAGKAKEVAKDVADKAGPEQPPASNA